MSWLLDTCVLSDFARGDQSTLRRLKATPPAQVSLSTITIMEVEYGLARVPRRAVTIAPVMRALLGAATALPYSAEDARVSASVRAALEKAGIPIGAYDVLIAGTALAHGLILVTSNIREFERVPGLRVENWRGKGI